MTDWKVVAASARGTLHAARNEPCQDASHWLTSAGLVVGVVSDGAGSARHAETGAQALSRGVCEYLMTRHVAGSLMLDDCGRLTEEIETAVQSVREQLDARDPNIPLCDYHATLVGCIGTVAGGWFFHIGDGLGAAVYDGNWDDCTLSLPENGEYADQTWFFTLDDWRTHLRLTPFDGGMDCVVLMSDGTMTFAAAPRQQGLDPAFMEPVARYLAMHDAKQGAAALQATLDASQTHAITSDDKTLLWASPG